jgi:mannosyltransferase OCH1-like enzyme
MQEWKVLHPTFEYRFWSDTAIETYMRESHPDFYPQWKAYPHMIMRIDAWRYFALRDFGGIYADLDVVPLQNMEVALRGVEADVCLTTSADSTDYTNCFMVSKPGAEFWDLVIENLKRPELPFYAIGKHATVLLTTGPGFLTHVIRNQYRGILAHLPSKMWNPATSKEIANGKAYQKAVSQNAVLYNLDGRSWHGLDSKLFNLFATTSNWVLIVIVGFLVLLIAFLLYRRYSRIGPEDSFSNYLLLPKRKPVAYSWV